MIKRNIFTVLKHHLSAKEMTVLVGPRQVGKTTLLKLLQKDLEKSGKQTLFLNLDYEPDSHYITTQQNLLAKIELEFGNSEGYVFIDEIQRKKNAGLFLKGMYDLGLSCKFIISGSGSLELKEKIHESLAGRKRLFEIYPVSFEEFVNYRTGYKYTKKIVQYFNIERDEGNRFLREYMNFGGYPRIITESKKDEKIQLMNDIFRSYVERDIVYLLNIDRIDAFTNLVKILAANIGQIINYSSIAARLNISLPTLKKYIWYLEKTFIIKLLTPYHKNYKKEITKSPLIYFNDLGFLNYALGKFGFYTEIKNQGFLFQNFVYTILREKFSKYSDKIHFWRTSDKAEVDFVIEQSAGILPIEVKCTSLNKRTVKRSLRSFIKKYNPQKALVINLDYHNSLMIDDTEVEFLPYYLLFDYS